MVIDQKFNGILNIKFLLLFCAIIFPPFALHAAQNKVSDLEKKLRTTQGLERLHILTQLTESLHSDDPKKAIEYGKEALAILKNNPDFRSEISVLTDLGWAYLTLSDYENAIAYSEQARKLAEKQNDREGLSDALNNLGVVAQRRDQPIVAVNYFEQSLEIQKQLNLKEDIANSLNNLGFVYSMALTDYDRGVEYHLQALKLREELKDQEGIALSLNNLGIVYGRLGDSEKALDYLNRALELRKKLGLKQRTASTLNNIGDVYIKLGQYEKSLEINRQSLQLRREIGERSGVAMSLRDIGETYTLLGQIDQAEKYLTDALNLTEELGDKGTKVLTLISLSAMNRKRGNFAEAEKLATQALQTAQSISAKERLRQALQELAAAQESSGKNDKALDTYKRFKEVNDSIFNEERARRLALLESRYQLEKREREIEKLKKDQAILDLHLHSERSQRNAIVGGSILLGIVGFLMYRRRVESARIAEQLSLTDSLTGLRNRRFIWQTIGYDLASCLRKYRAALYSGTYPRYADVIFLVIDLDEFKLINDQYGHSAGDEILKQITNVLQSGCRAADTIVRWGGEEFLIVSRFSNREDAGIMAERFRALIESADLKIGPEETIRITCSIGFAAFPFIRSNPDAFTWEQVIAFADGSLFAAKRSSRNAWIGLNTTEKANLKDLSGRHSTNLRKWIDQGELTVDSSLPASTIQW
ncbi:diguanylate cyclase [bacterium]|nr:diguanylate cyclase [bacterium]